MTELDRVLPHLLGFPDWALNKQTPNYPPTNIIKHADDSYEIDVAVAGFDRDALTVTKDGQKLLVTGQQISGKSDNASYIRHGIAARDFKLMYTVGEFIEVEEVELKLGILSIRLKKNIPEERKPRRFDIN